MKNYIKILTLFFFVFNTTYLTAQTNIPTEEDYLSGLTQIYDPNFEQALIDLGHDNRLDGYVETVNIETITVLNIANKNIENLKGIEDFIALQKLYCQNNSLKTIDLVTLLSLNELNCANNGLITLNTTKNINLSILKCNDNLLKDLNLIKNSFLIVVECQNNNLKSINAKNGTNTSLQIFNTKNNLLLNKIDIDNENNINVNWQKDDISTYIQNRNPDSCESSVFIPDLNFRNELISLGYTFINGTFLCLDEDNSIPVSDTTSLNLYNLDIANLAGIEHFTSLITLNCNNNNLTNINLNGNLDLRYLYCEGNQLTNLNVLQNIDLRELECFGNELINLDLIQNIYLEELSCGNNQLTSLDVIQNVHLKKLECGSNQLNSLSVTQNVDLKELKCGNNPLTSLDLTQNIALEILRFHGCLINNLDLSQNVVLKELSSGGSNSLTSLDLSQNTDLRLIFHISSNLISIDLSQCIELEYLDLQGNDLTNLDVTQNIVLEHLNCWNNQIPNLDVTNNITLEFLNCTLNPFLNNLNVTQNIVLKKLYCIDNQLTVLDVTKNVELEILNCGYNQLANLDVTKNVELEKLHCHYNQSIDNIDLTQNVLLEEFNSNSNSLTNLDTTQNIMLKKLLCSTNQLTSLDLTQNVILEQLYIGNNQLTNLDIRSDNNTDIFSFYVISNNLCYIYVDNVEYSTTNWINIDEGTVFIEDENEIEVLNCDECQNLQPTTPTISNIGINELELNWNTTDPLPTGWEITYSTTPNFDPETATSIEITDPNATRYIFTSLDSNTTYYFRVRAICTENTFSDWSPETNATTLDCLAPTNLHSTTTDTSVYLSWYNDNEYPSPIGGWIVSYAFGTHTSIDGVSIIDSFTTYQPEALIEDLIPSNDYTFFVQAICSEISSSDVISEAITTNCTNCNSFVPQPGKEYVVSAWVKEEWSVRPEVTMNPNTDHINDMLNDLVHRYNLYYNPSGPPPSPNPIANGICPNGTVVNGLFQMNALDITNDNIYNPFHEELLTTIDNSGQTNLNGQLQAGIYNFRYNNEGNKSEFQFQFTPGELIFSENLLINSGAEYIVGSDREDILNWHNNGLGFYFDSDDVESITSGQCNNAPDVIEEGGDRFFSSGICSGNHSSDDSRLYQDIAISDYSINNGNGVLQFGGWLFSDNDIPYIIVKYLDGEGNPILDQSLSPPQPVEDILGINNVDDNQNQWIYVSSERPIPIKTQNIRFELYGHHISGTNNNAFFDEVFLKMGTYTDSENMQTFDVDCYNSDSLTTEQETFTVEDPLHYPLSNYFYDLAYDCLGNTIESKYKYYANTFRPYEEIIAVNKQVFTYAHTAIQLSYLDEQNNILLSNLDRTFYPTGDIIDGWQRIQGVFKVPQNTVTVKIELVNNLDGPDDPNDPIDPNDPNDHRSDAYFDDVRIFPKDGNMKSFVYDQQTQRLMAELDENNYATFYEYDKEGGLIRVKKETEKGVFTIQETRSGNVKKD